MFYRCFAAQDDFPALSLHSVNYQIV